MILHIIDADGRPLVMAARRVLVLCDDGQAPIALAADRPGGAVEVAQAALPDGTPDSTFDKMLDSAGVSRTLILNRALLRPLSDFRFGRDPS